MSKYDQDVEEVNPNLIPIMNLFTALIPFLLMSAVFYQMAIIQITIPVASSSGETDIAKEEDKITLNLQIFEDRFEMSASSDTLAPEVISKLKATIPRPKSDDQKAVYEELSKAAHQIKGKYVSSDTTIVVPEEDIPYQVIIEAVDAVRRIRLPEQNNATVMLFPKVVLSSRVK